MKKLLISTAICGSAILVHQLAAMALMVGYRIEITGMSGSKVKGQYSYVDGWGKTQIKEIDQNLPVSIWLNANYYSPVRASISEKEIPANTKVRIYKNASVCTEQEDSAIC
jgi:hypothetical protein